MTMRPDFSSACACPSKAPVEDRPLLGAEEAQRLGRLFQMLANDTRLRMLHALVRARELSPSELAAALGMKPQAVSNQLQRLTDRGILGARRNGNQVYYRIVDPCVVSLLDQGLCLAEDAEARSGGVLWPGTPRVTSSSDQQRKSNS